MMAHMAGPLLSHVQARPPTERQRQILMLLNRPLPPTHRELGQLMGIKSTNGIACHLRSLERHGWITRSPLASRGNMLTPAGLAIIGAPAPTIAPVTCLCSADSVAETMHRFVLLFRRGETGPTLLLGRKNLSATNELGVGDIKFCPWCGKGITVPCSIP